MSDSYSWGSIVEECCDSFPTHRDLFIYLIAGKVEEKETNSAALASGDLSGRSSQSEA
jgi:hypothetical protein